MNDFTKDFNRAIRESHKRDEPVADNEPGTLQEVRPGRTPGVSPPPSAAPFRKRGKLRSIEGLKRGDLLIQPLGKFGKGENLVRITRVEPDKAYGIFADPDDPRTPRMASDQEFVIWDFEAKDFYYAESVQPAPGTQPIQEAQKEVPQELIAKMRQKENDELELWDIGEEMKPKTIRDVMDANVLETLKRELGRSFDKNIKLFSRYGWELDGTKEDDKGGVTGSLKVNGYGDIAYGDQNIATFEVVGIGLGWANSGDSEYTYSLDEIHLFTDDVGEEL